MDYERSLRLQRSKRDEAPWRTLCENEHANPTLSALLATLGLRPGLSSGQIRRLLSPFLTHG